MVIKYFISFNTIRYYTWLVYTIFWRCTYNYSDIEAFPRFNGKNENEQLDEPFAGIVRQFLARVIPYDLRYAVSINQHQTLETD